MKKILTLAITAMLGLFIVGCDDSSSSDSNNNGDNGGSSSDVSYTTRWQVYLGGDNGYTTQFSVTREQFPGISYQLNNGSLNGPINSSATRNYYGEADTAERPYLTHWETDEDSLTDYPYEGVNYTMVTAQNSGVSNSNQQTFFIWEGTANGDENDFNRDNSYEPPEYVPPDNDDVPSDGTGDTGTGDTGTGDTGTGDTGTGDTGTGGTGTGDTGTGGTGDVLISPNPNA
jgi:hypothetical protein